MILDNVRVVLKFQSVSCKLSFSRPLDTCTLNGLQSAMLYIRTTGWESYIGTFQAQVPKLFSISSGLHDLSVTNNETNCILRDTINRGDTRHCFVKAPINFRLFLPTESILKFGGVLLQNLMFLEGKAIFQLVNTTKHYCAVTFLGILGVKFSQREDKIWLSLAITWCLMFTG